MKDFLKSFFSALSAGAAWMTYMIFIFLVLAYFMGWIGKEKSDEKPTLEMGAKYSETDSLNTELNEVLHEIDDLVSRYGGGSVKSP